MRQRRCRQSARAPRSSSDGESAALLRRASVVGGPEMDSVSSIAGILRRRQVALHGARKKSCESSRSSEIQCAARAPLAFALDTVVVGAGVSGLRAAALLGAAGQRVCVLDAADSVGGRVRTDVTLMASSSTADSPSSYPRTRNRKRRSITTRWRSGNFWPGAMVQRAADRCLIADPTRAPLSTLLPTLRFPIGTVAEKVRLSLAVLRLKLTSLEAIFARDEIDTLSHLRDRIGLGNSELIARFFTPFLRGIYLAPLERQSSVLFDFVLRMFADGDVALPERGIGAVAEQLAATARDAGCDIQLESAVAALRLDVGDGVHEVVLADGSALRCANVILATPPGEAATLAALGVEVPGTGGALPQPRAGERRVARLHHDIFRP